MAFGRCLKYSIQKETHCVKVFCKEMPSGWLVIYHKEQTRGNILEHEGQISLCQKMVEGLCLWTDEGSAAIMEEKNNILLEFVSYTLFYVSPLWVEATGL